MRTHYNTLGLQSSATVDEIRRAYRILARRYHPDLNPGQENVEKFRLISEAYEVLSDTSRRIHYDAQLESSQRANVNQGFDAYERAQARRSRIRREFETPRYDQFGKVSPESKTKKNKQPEDSPATSKKKFRKVTEQFRELLRSTVGIGSSQSANKPSINAQSSGAYTQGVERVSVIEVSISIHDAIIGVKKAIEIPEPEGARKISVRIPAGVKNGSVVRLRAKKLPGEDLVLIVRVANHPFITIQTRGLVVEVPITIQEAILGASISVPTLEEPVSIKVPSASQSGSEIRLKNRGILLKDGTRGDLFIRLLVRVPELVDAVGLREKTIGLEQYYSNSVRKGFPKSLLE